MDVRDINELDREMLQRIATRMQPSPLRNAAQRQLRRLAALASMLAPQFPMPDDYERAAAFARVVERVKGLGQ